MNVSEFKRQKPVYNRRGADETKSHGLQHCPRELCELSPRTRERRRGPLYMEITYVRKTGGDDIEDPTSRKMKERKFPGEILNQEYLVLKVKAECCQ